MKEKINNLSRMIRWFTPFLVLLLAGGSVQAQTCTAAFTYTPGISADCGIVNYTNTSTYTPGVASYTWGFGDGATSTTTVTAVSHSFSIPGVYTTTLTIATYDASTLLCTNSVMHTFTVCPCDPEFIVTQGVQCNTFLFNSSLEGADAYHWTFGDGATSSTDDPTHTYTVNGSYAVTLSVTVGTQTCTSTQTVVVDCQCDGDFTYTHGGGPDCYMYAFSSDQEDATSYAWTFGDGGTSTLDDPGHTYTADGNYTVTLTTVVGTATCTSTQTVVVNCECTAGFSYDHGVLSDCYIYSFEAEEEQGTGVVYSWNFGDMSGVTSYTMNTMAGHTYTVDGTYAVTLTVTAGTLTCTTTQTVVVNCSCDPEFIYDHGVMSDCYLFEFEANETPGSGVTYSWNFGDPGSGSNTYTSTASSAGHTYTIDGTYAVSLTVTVGSNTCVSTQTITVNCCPDVTFTFTHGNQSDCGIYSFTSTVTNQGGYDISYAWDFGDGGTSTSANPGHTYTASGSYTVTLTITASSLSTVFCTATYSMVVNVCPVETVPCEDCIGSFAPIPDSTYVIGAWVHQTNSAGAITYNDPYILVAFVGPNTTTAPLKGKGLIIDGWQRIEENFVIPTGTTSIRIELVNGGSGDVFFDDIRVHPFHSNLKSFVYDPITLRLMAELDENNYATFYEYDEEGALIRVKKETERGIKTIKEAGNNTRKKP